jgi:hypothetical protein
MTTEQLRDKIHAVPFLPFYLRLPDGEEVLVPHPDFIAHAPNTRTCVVTTLEGGHRVIDLLLVSQLRVEEPAR